MISLFSRNITDARFSAFLIEVIDLTLELYASTIGTCPQTDRIFVDIRKRVDKETRTLRQLMMLKGPLDLVLTANQTKKSTLTCEERMLKQILKEDEDPYLFKLLNFWNTSLVLYLYNVIINFVISDIVIIIFFLGRLTWGFANCSYSASYVPHIMTAS